MLRVEQIRLDGRGPVRYRECPPGVVPAPVGDLAECAADRRRASPAATSSTLPASGFSDRSARDSGYISARSDRRRTPVCTGRRAAASVTCRITPSHCAPAWSRTSGGESVGGGGHPGEIEVDHRLRIVLGVDEGCPRSHGTAPRCCALRRRSRPRRGTSRGRAGLSPRSAGSATAASSGALRDRSRCPRVASRRARRRRARHRCRGCAHQCRASSPMVSP